jgi:hypothetical protein
VSVEDAGNLESEAVEAVAAVAAVAEQGQRQERRGCSSWGVADGCQQLGEEGDYYELVKSRVVDGQGQARTRSGWLWLVWLVSPICLNVDGPLHRQSVVPLIHYGPV